MRPLWSCLLLLLLSASFPARAQQAAPDREARLAAWLEGMQLLDRGELAAAARLAEDRLRAAPSRLEMAEMLFLAHQAACEGERAAAICGEILGTDDGESASPLARYRAGMALVEDWRQGEALAELRRGAEICAGAGDALSRLFCLRAMCRSILLNQDLDLLEPVCAEIASSLGDGPAETRIRDELQITRAHGLNLRNRTDQADSLYAELQPRAEAARQDRILLEVLNARSYIMARRRQFEPALALYRRTLALARSVGDRPREALILSSLGYYTTTVSRFDEARGLLEEALRLAEQCELPDVMAQTYSGLGSLAEMMGEREEAITWLRRAADVHVAIRFAHGELGASQRLAYNLMTQGHYSEAIRYYGRCLEIMDELGNHTIQNWVLAGLALACHKLGDLDQAEQFYGRALAVNREMGDLTSAAWCLNSLAILDLDRADYRRALAFAHEARALYEELGYRQGVGENHVTTAEINFLLGDYERAREHGEEAVAIAEELKNQELLQRASGALATILEATGRFDLAEDLFRRSLAIARRLEDHEAIVWGLGELGSHLLERGRREEARAYLEEASSLLSRVGMFLHRAIVLRARAQCADSPQEARAIAREALACAVDLGRPDLEWRCLADLGEYSLACGDTAVAREHLGRAIEVVESIRRDVGVSELQRHMLRPALRPYELLTDLLLAGAESATPSADAVRAALACSERSRAQILATRLRNALAHVHGGSGREPSAEELDLLSSLAHLQSRLQDAALTDGERDRLLADIERVEEEFAQLRIRMAAADREYAAMVYPEPEPVDQLLAALRPEERLLSYFLGTERSYLFLADRETVSVRVLPARREIEEKVALMLRLVYQASEAAGPADGDVPGPAGVPPEVLVAAGRELHDLLVAPAADALSPGEILVVVPDGLLHRLPFALLRTADGLLLDRHEIIQAPSLRTFSYLRTRSEERHLARSRPALDVCAVGCSGRQEGDGDGFRRISPFTGAPVVPLPHADREARRVARMFDRSLLLTGHDATERSLKASPLESATIVHLAAHSHADEREARRSFIVLNPAAGADSLGGVVEDGLLQWHEIASLRLGASLVSLASCRSAGGVLAVGEGITGLSQAFLFAGASCVLAAQTDVPDWYASRFMEQFYDRLRRGATIASALRDVQLAALRGSDPAVSPVWCASFLVVGDGGQVVVAGGRSPSALEIAVAAAAVLVLIVLGVSRASSRRRIW
jgi:CHAT domain-containing protein/tetratricopeptide (TPR) repeat protein